MIVIVRNPYMEKEYKVREDARYIENLTTRIYTSALDLSRNGGENIDYTKFTYYRLISDTWTLISANQYNTYFDCSGDYPIESVYDGALVLAWNSNYTDGAADTWKICYDGKEICKIRIYDFQDP